MKILSAALPEWATPGGLPHHASVGLSLSCFHYSQAAYLSLEAKHRRLCLTISLSQMAENGYRMATRTVNITMSDLDAGVVKRKGKCHVPRSLCMRIRVVFWYTWFFWFKSSSICTFTNSHSGLPWNYVKWILFFLYIYIIAIDFNHLILNVCHCL